MNRLSLAILSLAVTMGSASAQGSNVETVQAPLIGQKGDAIGQIDIRGNATATVVRVTVKPGGLPPGWHGMHFHTVGDCSDVGQFMLSKGHINHMGKKHGLLNPDGSEEGDLPNIYVSPDGSVNAEVSSRAVRVRGSNGLKNSDGSALVIHANEDDHMSQPIGNAGARIACAAIK